MTGDALRRALERLEPQVLRASSAEAALARREAGIGRLEDAALLRQRLEQVVAAQRPDGSWDGRLGCTARALLQLAELAAALVGAGGRTHAGQAPAVAQALSWLRSLRGAAGRFGDDCEPERHARGLCRHALSGFHGPGPEDAAEPEEALLVDSAQALRAALRWGEEGTALDQHLDGLRRVVSAWAWPEGEPVLGAACGVAAIDALLERPRTPEDVQAVAEGIACLVRTQRGDGTWHGVGLYEVLDTLLFGIRRGFRVEEVDGALARAGELLALLRGDHAHRRQRADAGQELTAWRVLRHVVAHEQEAGPPPA